MEEEEVEEEEEGRGGEVKWEGRVRVEEKKTSSLGRHPSPISNDLIRIFPRAPPMPFRDVGAAKDIFIAITAPSGLRERERE